MKKDYRKEILKASKILNSWLPHKIFYDRTPGISVGISYCGHPIYKGGFGLADIKRQRPMREDSCYRVASISKIFTAVAILQLIEQGKLKLSDLIGKYIPWLNLKTPKGNPAKITIREVLMHRGGFWRDGGTNQWEDDEFPNIEEIKKQFSDEVLAITKGGRFKYSNFGYALLGQVIKEASGIEYEDYVLKNIIKPLGLGNTFPDFSTKVLSKLARGYSADIPDKKRRKFINIKTNDYASAAGFVSNCADLLEFLEAISPESKNKIISRRSKLLMIKSARKANDMRSYGLGIEIHKIGKHKVVGHGGGFQGFITMLARDIENDISVAALTNCIDSAAEGINRAIFELVYYFLDKKPSLIKKIKNTSRYEGVYSSRWGDNVVLGVYGELYVFGVKDASPAKGIVHLVPNSKDSFIMDTKDKYDSYGEIAKFFIGKNGKAVAVRWGSGLNKKIS